MSISQIKRLDFLSPLAAVEFNMILLSRVRLIALLVFINAIFPSFSEENRTAVKIIERANFQKKMSVEKLTDSSDGQLRYYQTFSIKFLGKLVFCHISNDRSEPRVICH